jgi:hypothetical protein
VNPACAIAGRVLFKPSRDQRSDPPPERVGMCKSFDFPELAFLAHRPEANNALAVADDARVPFEVKVQPLVLHIGLRERTLAVQKRL